MMATVVILKLYDTRWNLQVNEQAAGLHAIGTCESCSTSERVYRHRAGSFVTSKGH